MAAGGEQGKAGCGDGVGIGIGIGIGVDLYAVLGLKKECSAADLRSAYKKLALRWHPDRCSASGSSKTVDEAKTKFQAIQEAYSVLSDTNKRFLYDVGVYDDDDADAANGMGEFLGEMAAMMNQAKPNEGGASETFEQLQDLFVEMFQADMDAFCVGGGSSSSGGGSTAASSWAQGWADGWDGPSTSSTCFSSATTTAASFHGGGRADGGGGHKRDSAEMCSGKAKGVAAFDGAAGLGLGSAFCFGAHDGNSSAAATRARAGSGGGGGKRRSGGKPKASSRHGGLA